ncbi:hypothetical protein HPP92_002477 [Vanilla planifolia]|uniref:Uncharacterized protein n=1 Tax=Vanilla planifolia TaxID=51239 RepID=A0A835VIJ3_VANPL|nr:hypothetical protein HPP92_002477 [Vanilla planifolia]
MMRMSTLTWKVRSYAHLRRKHGPCVVHKVSLMHAHIKSADACMQLLKVLSCMCQKQSCAVHDANVVHLEVLGKVDVASVMRELLMFASLVFCGVSLYFRLLVGYYNAMANSDELQFFRELPKFKDYEDITKEDLA